MLSNSVTSDAKHISEHRVLNSSDNNIEKETTSEKSIPVDKDEEEHHENDAEVESKEPNKDSSPDEELVLQNYTRQNQITDTPTTPDNQKTYQTMMDRISEVSHENESSEYDPNSLKSKSKESNISSPRLVAKIEKKIESFVESILEESDVSENKNDVKSSLSSSSSSSKRSSAVSLYSDNSNPTEDRILNNPVAQNTVENLNIPDENSETIAPIISVSDPVNRKGSKTDYQSINSVDTSFQSRERLSTLNLMNPDEIQNLLDKQLGLKEPSSIEADSQNKSREEVDDIVTGDTLESSEICGLKDENSQNVRIIQNEIDELSNNLHGNFEDQEHIYADNHNQDPVINDNHLLDKELYDIEPISEYLSDEIQTSINSPIGLGPQESLRSTSHVSHKSNSAAASTRRQSITSNSKITKEFTNKEIVEIEDDEGNLTTVETVNYTTQIQIITKQDTLKKKKRNGDEDDENLHWIEAYLILFLSNEITFLHVKIIFQTNSFMSITMFKISYSHTKQRILFQITAVTIGQRF